MQTAPLSRPGRWLIGALLALVPTLAAAEEALPEEGPAAPARSVAEMTQGLAQRLGEEIREVREMLAALEGEDLGAQLLSLGAELTDLGLIILVTIGLLLLLRPLARPAFNRAEAWATRGDPRFQAVRRTVGVLGAAIADLAVIAIAWLGGYAVALFVLGDMAALKPRQSLFLNAFVLVEGVKAVLRILFAARNEHLRLVPADNEHAVYWNRRLARMAGLIGYGLLFAAPLVSVATSELFGRATVVVVMAASFIYAVFLAFSNRNDVREQLQRSASRSRFLFTRTLLSGLAWSWHWLVVLYFGALTVVTVTQPELAFSYMAQGTLQTALAVGVGAFLALTLTQATGRRFQLGEQRRRSLPQLEQRLNAYIPFALKTARALIILIVGAAILDAWQVIDFFGWLTSEGGISAVGIIVSVALVLIAALAAWLGAATYIEHRLSPEAGKGKPTAREQTLLTLFRNAIAVVLATLTVMIVLAEIGINIGPLIAGAGVLGLAIGFGAQKLVQDIITGVFIQLENAIDVGDIITAAGITGTVEKLTIRSVNIRDLSGTYHFIPFSSVDAVSNFTRYFAYHVGQYGVAYKEDVEQVIPELEAAYEELKAHPDPEIREALYGDFAVDGVASLGDSAVNIRVRIQTAPGMQWAVGRAYNALVKKRLDAAGIEIPFPHRKIYYADDAERSALSAPVEAGGQAGAEGQAGAT